MTTETTSKKQLPTKAQAEKIRKALEWGSAYAKHLESIDKDYFKLPFGSEDT